MQEADLRNQKTEGKGRPFHFDPFFFSGYGLAYLKGVTSEAKEDGD